MCVNKNIHNLQTSALFGCFKFAIMLIAFKHPNVQWNTLIAVLQWNWVYSTYSVDRGPMLTCIVCYPRAWACFHWVSEKISQNSKSLEPSPIPGYFVTTWKIVQIILPGDCKIPIRILYGYHARIIYGYQIQIIYWSYIQLIYGYHV